MKRYLPHVAAFIIIFMVSLPALSFAEGLIPCDGTKQNPCNFSSFLIGVNTVINWLIMISIPLATIVIAWAGVLYITASGDMAKIKEAKGMIMTALIGFFFILSAWVLVKALLSALLDPNQQINTFLGN
jgi:hypothetical protein